MLITDKRGETIVEVLISIAMLSLAIVGSIYVAKNSLLLGQRAKERMAGLRVAEMQIERLKSRAQVDPDGEGVFDSGLSSAFCLDNPASGLAIVPAGNNACSASNVAPEMANQDFGMRVSITYDDKGPNNSAASVYDDHLYVVSVEWVDVDGEGTNNIQIELRVHPV